MSNKGIAKITSLLATVFCLFGMNSILPPAKSVKVDLPVASTPVGSSETTSNQTISGNTTEQTSDTVSSTTTRTTPKTTVLKEIKKEIVEDVGVGWDKIDGDSLGGLINDDIDMPATTQPATTKTTLTTILKTITSFLSTTKTATNGSLTTATTKLTSTSTTTKPTTTTTTAASTTATTTTTTTATPTTTKQQIDSRLKQGTINESVFMSKIKIKNTYTGTVYDGSTRENLQKAIAFVVKMEMGTARFGLKSVEAWKAQAVAAYTYLVRYCWNGATYSFSLSSDLNLNNAVDKKIYDAVGEVLGVKLLDTSQSNTYNQLCLTSYFAASAGVTSSSGKVWVSQLPYLKSVSSEVETDEMIKYYTGGYMGLISTYKTTYTNVIEKLTAKYGKIYAEEKAGEPCIYAVEWDGGVGKYIYKTNLYYYNSSNQKVYITGANFRDTVGYIRSHAFTVTQNGDELTFTALGYGHGVGLSQMGAVIYANEHGWDYIKILQHYYSVTSTSKHQLVAPLW